MATDERARHQLYQRLEEALGAEPATTLMEHLPPVGWADVATKADLAAVEQRLEVRMDRRFDRIDDRIDDRFARLDDRFDALEYKLLAAFRGEMNTAITAQTRSFIIATVTVFTAFAAFALGIRIL